MKIFINLMFKSVVVLLVFFLGFKVGSHYTYGKLNNYYSTLLYSGAATGIKTKIILLELLHDNDVLTVRERLESLLDADLAYLSLYVDKNIEKPNNDIIEAIEKAKIYKKQYPGHHINNIIEKSVNRTLEYVK